jgi:hypothetical protein
MHLPTSRITVVAIAAVLTLAVQVGVEGVDVQVDHDKAFDFKTMRTWAWNPEGAGDVVMARTQEDDKEAMKRRAEPVIRDAVAMEMMRRGLQAVDTTPDLTLTYYLVLTTNMTTQTMGQFLPGTTAWALPPFAQATQSMKMMNQGALLLVLSAKGEQVWRGLAQAKVAFDATNTKREAVLREGVRDLLKRYPPKQ